ncbi:MAG: hypothetical protein OPY06_02555 [Nitrosopumilus sp.]|nr:hypothetical protein [Nitrosopumilus sp.]MDF2422679.1 hypothetical protein [Nitrosopumilus sp.]MDF2423914.1 hypothetical protein [Nitrosopumilus sp.]MDF2425686.1 hypothetical protein [Nitrosopumilus sp.]MDF2426395.1 hypothetical protein [Nitrosopumilus sp.]
MMSQNEPNLELYERERVVFEAIKNSPNSHHNELIKQIVPKFMAKTTFEKTRDSLLDKEIIFVRKQGNMKFYLPTENYEVKLQHKIERNTTNSFHDLKLKIKKLDFDYSHKDVDEKIAVANFLLKNLIHVDNGFTILDSAKNPKRTLYHDEHLTIQQLIHNVFEIIRKDRDFETIFPAIMGNLEILISRGSSDK